MDKKYYKVILDLPKLEYFTGQVFISDGNGYYNLFGYPVRPKVHSEFVEGNPISFREMTSEEISDFNNFFSFNALSIGVSSKKMMDVFEKGNDLVTEDSSLIEHLRLHTGNKNNSKEKEEEVIRLRKESSELEKAISNALSKGVSVQEITNVLRDIDSTAKKEISKMEERFYGQKNENDFLGETPFEKILKGTVDIKQKTILRDIYRLEKKYLDRIWDESEPMIGYFDIIRFEYSKKTVAKLWEYINLVEFNVSDVLFEKFTDHIQWLKQRKKN